ncbi:HTH domain-containing protein [Haloarcula virus HCTV-8]|uniref:HTH domain-containing protein n=4 Tax=Haloferacalesvirus TaxID=2843389 RepID=A0AAE8XW94_9CAUD|nr:HNH endonuclease [Halorubrum tailed phage 5]UBF20412.1 HTH domain-containing protein [Haloarcula phage HCTV-7]UBF20528.1 HTH domain-containing protein [Haloarcula phage HCTV-9]UBF20644.1 HTH domain-containing protein [Haloarcula phage HCTV-11]UBF20759.1 HTH domain-containing protein [Halorubrum virus HRTV-9]UBF20984.1 HTH domain-containing protein [Haloarcula virus HCTV-8]UBF21096.1 HTH domain-containing protein [Haloarcula virus HCTV-10]UBF21457.1 HTH domain-containing protein [Halorubru
MSTLADFGAKIPDKDPWKDKETLRELYHDKGLDQSEMGDELGCSAGTISYWMDKLGVNTTHTKHNSTQQEPQAEDWECEYFEVCGNETPGPRNGLCDDCLDMVRDNQSAYYDGEKVERSSFEDMTEFVKTLYELRGKDSENQ